MAHTIEAAKSGRASCRKCKEKIAKGELRFGLEVPNDFAEGETSYRWFHLACAAKGQPIELALGLAETEVEVPERAELEAACAENRKKVKPSTFPYGERAPSGRAACMECEEKIAKGELRVAVEREVDAGGFGRPSAGYLHPRCAAEYTGEDAAALLEQLRAHSTQLEDPDFAELERGLAG
jgi:hypothetical protein